MSRALREAGIAERVVHSGQHYDHAMSGRFLEELGIAIDANLEAGSGSHAQQTAQIMSRFETYLAGLVTPTDAILVYGDTNSTVAAALVAAKLHVPLVHVEAGLRSYNRRMPEEVNRVVTDHLSQLLFCSSEQGQTNLAREGLTEGVHVTGDVMFDAFRHFSSRITPGATAARILGEARTGFVLMTLHRPSNTDDPTFLPRLRTVLGRIDMPVIWPVHPRFRAAVEAADLPAHVHRIEPVGYFEMLDLLDGCGHVITDSGGLQKEAYWARRACITLRDETEWVETLEGCWNVLANLDDNVPALLARTPKTEWTPQYGDGQACARIARLLRDGVERRS
ncbi:UDP-N-acetylglucosamine 2-epimerase (non-hydrolyzing) (plasmid) [Limimaricola variabilis]|uniref:non-hydrolyzing UDP-N-acetylglucosamine 2-epimerase n=1 Tax=Limimaricola variabilis TaxID=1492771 RepID=UPI002AC99EAB|nr:UDP-N-acetylglucosamine 2-epimerase (non-hydrolyzing) [Limimaricola variabilis]WPY96239.1 UDP-N-acetylglucosamine 2-epimerase (non-hydrolyzing) [Limimaricola variabilis]